MNSRTEEPHFGGCWKLSSASAPATSTGNMAAVFRAILVCLTPSWACRNSAIFHNSVPIESMMEEDKRPKFVNSIDNLPDFLLIDIIQRLPLDSVFVSKCVSKNWLSLISDPMFARSYASRKPSIPRPLALFYISSVLKPRQPCEIGPYCPYFGSNSMNFAVNMFKTKLQQRQRETFPLQLIGSDRDLLLFSGSSNSSKESTYCLCNPLTFEWLTLPQIKGYRIRCPAAGFMVEEDGTFWVVQIIPRWSTPLLSFLVFHSANGKWCIKEVLNTRPFRLFRAKATMVYRGMIMWMVDVGLLAFDPKNDGGRCRVIDLPNNKKGRLGVSCGNLHYYEVSSYGHLKTIENPILRVWMLMDFDGRDWTLKHSILYGDLWSGDEYLNRSLASPNTDKYFHLVAFHPLNSDMIFLKCDGELVSCEISSAYLEVLSCDPSDATFYRLEWDVLPLVLGLWPTSLSTFRKKYNQV
ncbi:putative F-box protein At3g28280 [Primulina huaijiensis]|uniref:putative F-box protein At3g28280 n=1 Tax=Primulina huaijiensis TaxID=1492673 RepID=UPI003CC7276F